MTPTADLAIVDLRQEIKLYEELRDGNQKDLHLFSEPLASVVKGKIAAYKIVIERLTSALKRWEANYELENPDE